VIRAAWVVLRLELFSLLRVRETYTFALLPAALVVPLSLALAVLVLSFVGRAVVVIPEGDFAPVAVVEALEDEYTVRRVADPRATFALGEVESAVVAVHAGHPPRVEVLADDENGLRKLRSTLREGYTADLDARITEAGGKGKADRVLAEVTLASSAERGEDLVQGMWSLFVVAGGYLGCFLLPVRTASDRLSGALEAMAVTATSMTWVFGARVLVCTAFVCLLTVLPQASLWVLVSRKVSLSIPVFDVVEAVLVLVLVNGWLVGCGLVANSVRMALYYGSYFVMACMVPLAAPVFLHWPLVPVLGLAEPGLGPQLFRIVLTVALIVATLAALGHLGSGERVLPPGEGDE